MTDRQRIAPDLDQFRAAWKMGLRWCSWCHTWVRAEEANRQMGCPNSVWACNECIEADDAREKRVAPEAVIELRPARLPARLGALWNFMEESDE